jgi:uncharacterized protein (TIGR03435 family)
MIPAYWTSTLANHLWQSTVVVAVAALLAFALRKNQARTRYWLWLAASVKFLIPFSLLIAAGSRLTWTAPTPMARQQVSAVVGPITQPFPEMGSRGIVVPVVAAQHHADLSIILLSVWICGFLAVTFAWWRRWRQIRAGMRAASPISIETDVPVLSIPELLEPGIFGIFRPVLLLPEGVSDRLSVPHLKSIIAHELCHVRRRDNLAAAVHMAVEAIFWFHPLVWWIESRMVEERERACDEEVLSLGSEPVVYAESILKTCQFYLESPLVCVSGITGADLKKRIVNIMTQRFVDKLSFSRKVLLVFVATVVIAVPVLFGLARQAETQSQPAGSGSLKTFEVASVKPNRSGDRRMQIGDTPGGFRAVNVTPKMLIEFAYNVKDPQLSGGPSWIETERYDIDAKADDPPDDSVSSVTASVGSNVKSVANKRGEPMDLMNERRRQMVQSLLADRFKLTLTRETKDLPIYALVVTKGGPKFHETALPPIDPNNPPAPDGPPRPGQPFRGRGIMMGIGRGQLTMNGVPMSALADALSNQLGRNVVDKTELKGDYDLSLKWTPEEGQGRFFGGAPGAPDGRPAGDAPPPPDPSGPSIFTALQEQLGLKLESTKGPVETLVISSIERPSEN